MMRLRERYLQELAALHADLRSLGELVIVAITRSVDALVQQATSMAEQVVADDQRIDQNQSALEEQVLVVMANQQPIAGDLRRLVAAIEIASELERIGDYAKGIAKVIIRNSGLSHITPPADLTEMARQAIAMLGEVLDAYVQEDAAVGQRLAAADDRVDELRKHIRAELIEFMQRDSAAVPGAVDLLFVTHYLERIADRTTNIAERIVFIISGEMIELNP
jgi:phosphate transport system protein